MRVQFADDVMKSIKIKSKWDKDKIKAEVEKRINASWSDEVHEFDRLYPNMISRTSLTIDFMTRPEADWNTRYVRAHVYVNSEMKGIKVDDLKTRWADYLKEIEDRKIMRARILEIAHSVTTDTALAAVFPELVKFIPKPEVKPVKMLPISQKSIVADLMKMGLEVTK
jgi:hypothetical protein